MNKIQSTLLAPVLALSALALCTSSAWAFGHDRGGREGGGRGGYASAPRNEGRGGGYPGGFPARGYSGGRGYAPQAYAPQGYSYGPFDRPGFSRGGRGMGEIDAPADAPLARDFRRGQYLPHAYWNGEIANPRSRHLRTPPPGYGWIGVGPNAYLMQRSTGLVLDSVPGAW